LTLLILAALCEELALARDLCQSKARMEPRSLNLWHGLCRDRSYYFLKTGIGPRRSARKLEHALTFLKPSSILVTGYAGALDPSLKAGDLVVAPRASMIGKAGDPHDSWELGPAEELAHVATRAGLPAFVGEILTSPRPVVRAITKSRLFRDSRASAVDMETAALARTAAQACIPVGCVRAITDEAGENLALWHVTPRATVAVARQRLRRFFTAYFELEQPARQS
jgi:adenosylhomocysteine nucleosidase